MTPDDTPITTIPEALEAAARDEFDELAYRFWSIHPRDVPNPISMPERYPGGARAWMYANEMRALSARIAAPVAVAGRDVVYTEGFPDGWSMVHRADCTLLCPPPDHLGLKTAVAAAPKLLQGKRWMGQAQMIAGALSGAAKEDRARREAEFCDKCGYGPRTDDDGETLPNTHATKTWVCDNCEHRNDRPLSTLTIQPAAQVQAEAVAGACPHCGKDSHSDSKVVE